MPAERDGQEREVQPVAVKCGREEGQRREQQQVQREVPPLRSVISSTQEAA
jgi:hypothetical protein